MSTARTLSYPEWRAGLNWIWTQSKKSSSIPSHLSVRLDSDKASPDMKTCYNLHGAHNEAEEGDRNSCPAMATTRRHPRQTGGSGGAMARSRSGGRTTSWHWGWNGVAGGALVVMLCCLNALSSISSVAAEHEASVTTVTQSGYTTAGTEIPTSTEFGEYKSLSWLRRPLIDHHHRKQYF